MNSVAANEVDPALFRPPKTILRNPTIWLFACCVCAFAGSTTLYLWEWISRGTAALLATVCLYCLYTVSHEAVHGNAHSNRRLNMWLGRISSAIEGMTFPLFRVIHLQHHAFTNDPIRDPDFVIGRKPRWLLPIWTMVRLTHDNGFMVRSGLWSGRRQQLREHLLTVLIQCTAIAAGVAGAGLEFVLWAWIGPVLVSGALLELTVAWAVHFPHVSRHPLEHTRNFRGPLLQALTLNQSYHLVHHLWPRIPWFRYTRAADTADRAVAEHRRSKSTAPG